MLFVQRPVWGRIVFTDVDQNGFVVCPSSVSLSLLYDSFVLQDLLIEASVYLNKGTSTQPRFVKEQYTLPRAIDILGLLDTNHPPAQVSSLAVRPPYACYSCWPCPIWRHVHWT